MLLDRVNVSTTAGSVRARLRADHDDDDEDYDDFLSMLIVLSEEW